MGKIFVLVKDVPYQIDVNDFDSVTHICDTDWTLNPDLQGEDRYECVRTGELFYCDSLGRNTCTVNNEFVGTHQETRFEDRWIEIQKTGPRDTKTQRQLLSKTIRSEFTPREKASDLITSGETKFYRIDLRIPQNSNNEFYIEAIGVLGAYGLLDPWYNSNWGHRKLITINSTEVNSNLTNFPYLINFTDTDLRDDAQADGDDILFTNFDNTTKLSHEIEDYDSSDGTLTAWVKIPTVSSSSDTQIYMYYNNSAASNQEDITGTWTNYLWVHHLNDDFLDSTSNNIDGTNSGSADVKGRIADGQDFERSDPDTIDFGDVTSVDGKNQLTWSWWVKYESSPIMGVNSKRGSGGNHWSIGSDAYCSGCATIEMYGTGGAIAYGWADLADNTWGLQHHRLNASNVANEKDDFFIDGVDQGVPTTNLADTGFTGLINNAFDMKYGQLRNDKSWEYDGILDEGRLYDGLLSDDWIDYEFCNQNPTSFINASEGATCPAWSIGNEEDAPSGDNCDPTCTQNLSDGLIIGDSLITITLVNFTDGVIIGDNVTLTLQDASSTFQGGGVIIGDSVTLELTCNITCTLNLGDGLIIGDLVTPSGVSIPSFNALVLRVNPAQNVTLGGVFALFCPTNSTLTGLFTNGTFICTPMSDFFP